MDDDIFNKSFLDLPTNEDDPIGKKIAKTAGHLIIVMVAIYTGYHGIHASWNYTDGATLSRFAQVVGIVSLELSLMVFHLGLFSHWIIDTGQRLVSLLAMVVILLLVTAGTVADSQLTNGVVLHDGLAFYLNWILPASPIIMIVAWLVVFELDPTHTQKRKRALQVLAQEAEEFAAQLASARAKLYQQKTLANAQLAIQNQMVKMVQGYFKGDEARELAHKTAQDNIPALLEQAGIKAQSTSTQNSILVESPHRPTITQFDSGKNGIVAKGKNDPPLA